MHCPVTQQTVKRTRRNILQQHHACCIGDDFRWDQHYVVPRKAAKQKYRNVQQGGTGLNKYSLSENARRRCESVDILEAAAIDCQRKLCQVFAFAPANPDSPVPARYRYGHTSLNSHLWRNDSKWTRPGGYRRWCGKAIGIGTAQLLIDGSDEAYLFLHENTVGPQDRPSCRYINIHLSK